MRSVFILTFCLLSSLLYSQENLEKQISNLLDDLHEDAARQVLSRSQD